jgi:hypothetical protein
MDMPMREGITMKKGYGVYIVNIATGKSEMVERLHSKSAALTAGKLLSKAQPTIFIVVKKA